MDYNSLIIYMDQGLIVSGGEGLFVETLASNGNAVPILCGRYNYQYEDIAFSLLQMSQMIHILESPDERLKYRFVTDKNNRILYYDDHRHLNVSDRFNSVPEAELAESKIL